MRCFLAFLTLAFMTTVVGCGETELDVDGVFTPNESTTVGMLNALRSKGFAGKVKFVGFDSSKPLVDGLKKGDIDALTVQNPSRMGYEGVMTVVNHLEGQEVGDVDTGVAVITKANMDEPDMKTLLQPADTTDSGPPIESDKKYSIAVIPKGETHVFWQSVLAGALKAKAELAEKNIAVARLFSRKSD